MKETVGKINETKNSFFEKIIKINKFFSRLTKIKERRYK